MKETLIIKVNSLKDNIIDKALDRMNNYYLKIMMITFKNLN